VAVRSFVRSTTSTGRTAGAEPERFGNGGRDRGRDGERADETAVSAAAAREVCAAGRRSFENHSRALSLALSVFLAS